MDKKSSKPSLTTLFYDGGCSLCQREIAHYKRLDDNKRIDWVDISTTPEQLQAYGIDYDTAMSRLHVVDKDGRVQSGVKAFLTAWADLPYYRWLAMIIQSLHIVPVLEWAYQRFARWRLARRSGIDCTTQCAKNSMNSVTPSRKSENG